MNIVIGPPVEGDDFFGREKEQRQIWRKLNNHNLLMLAPRRIGKTSLLKKLRDTASEQHKLVLYTSFAGCNDELACINELIKSLSPYQELSKKVTDGIGQRLKTIKGFKLFGVGLDLQRTDNQNWSMIGNELVSSFNLAMQQQNQLVICVDELPIFILRLLEQEEGLAKVKHFLNWFRDIRQQYNQQIKWILAGSIGLDTITKRLNIGDTINDLVPFPLGGFDNIVACEFIDKLAAAEQLTINDEVKLHLLNKIGWNVPYYIQIMLDSLADEVGDLQHPVTVEDIDNAFEVKLNPEYKMYFDYWRQRLTEELGKPDDGFAIALLNLIAKSTKSVSRDNLLQCLLGQVAVEEAELKLAYLLDVLINDGYLVEDDKGYRFRLIWLQVYWQRRVNGRTNGRTNESASRNSVQGAKQ